MMMKLKLGRSRRGFTLSELMIAIGISSLVMMTTAGLMYMAARQTKDIVGQTRMRSARTQAIDEIRYRLSNAKIGTITITDSNRDITFLNPNVSPTFKSRFYFSPDEKTLYYDDTDGEGDGPVPVARGPIEITFELQDSGAVVLVTVKSDSSMAYQQIDQQEGEVAVYLRNI
ncbi:prepilin-type N-terminal cleavage/methylation domain-containing protein [bacterium]|nr:prepilin-type N-terminal cleavage/methylation domain-containing protein [bacterium]